MPAIRSTLGTTSPFSVLLQSAKVVVLGTVVVADGDR